MKSYSFTKFTKPINLVFLLASLISLHGELVNAEYFSKELQIDNSTKTENETSIIPTNPFEIVEMIRRYNSMNDATKPSDAIDEALKSFNNMEEK